MEPMDSIYHCE